MVLHPHLHRCRSGVLSWVDEVLGVVDINPKDDMLAMRWRTTPIRTATARLKTMCSSKSVAQEKLKVLAVKWVIVAHQQLEKRDVIKEKEDPVPR